ncbi:MAG: S-methyl-5-thioribose-1-phosphate isomerase [Tepidisphaeraceae bacterium]|jgi:methylthioribose-1-phosphate isomerase
MLQTIKWDSDKLLLLDQTRLPLETLYLDIADERQMWDAIKRLVVRGAPAIGVAAAFGVYLGVRNFHGAELLPFYNRINAVADYLATSRPTAVNLFWALDRMRRAARDAGRDSHSLAPRQAIDFIKQRLLAECLAMIDEDNRVCRAIGEHGVSLLKDIARHPGNAEPHLGSEPVSRRPINILTHCNAGGLATVQYGTALAPIYVGTEQGLQFHVYSDETRPLLQGSRITAYELKENGIPVTVICDNMAATVMSRGKIDAVIVGTDRVAANGDVANKIGTHGVAILAKHFGVPFYVAAPLSSIDWKIADGSQIPIEERDPAEISRGFGRQTAPHGVQFYNPAFDVTPAALISALITELGVVRPPYRENLAAIRVSDVIRTP